MSFCTYYDYHGEIRHCSKHDLRHENEEARDVIKFIKNELIMLAITTPPASGTINIGDGDELWGDYATRRARELFEALDDAYYRKVVTGQAIEAMEEEPGMVTDDSDELVPWAETQKEECAQVKNETVSNSNDA